MSLFPRANKYEYASGLGDECMVWPGQIARLGCCQLSGVSPAEFGGIGRRAAAEAAVVARRRAVVGNEVPSAASGPAGPLPVAPGKRRAGPRNSWQKVSRSY